MYWTKDEIRLGLHNIDSIRLDVLIYLTDLLNKYHGVNKSLRYWDIICGNWIEYLLHAVYVSFTDGKPSKTGPICHPTILTTQHFANLSQENDSFHRHLSFLIFELRSGKKIKKYSYINERITLFENNNTTKIERFLSKFLTANPDVLICNPYFKCSKAEFASALLRWRKWVGFNSLNLSFNLGLTLDREWRSNSYDKYSGQDSFFEIVKSLIPIFLPVVFLEGFHNIREKVLDLRIKQPSILYTSVGLNFNLAFKIMAAEWTDNGTKLVNHQHGGCYGIDEEVVFEKFEKRVSDRFYSWGWTDESKKVVPLSPAFPASFNRNRKRLLLNCVIYPPKLQLLKFNPVPEMCIDFIDQTLEFIDSVKYIDNLLVRPYHQEYDLGFTHRVMENFPGVDVDYKKPSNFVRYSESRLVVHNYLGSAWLETLVLDIPTICFFDPEIHAFRETAQELIENLVNVGILHENGRSAGIFAAKVWNNVDSWWKKPEVRKARREFVERFACFSEEWQTDWENEFRRLLDER